MPVLRQPENTHAAFLTVLQYESFDTHRRQGRFNVEERREFNQSEWLQHVSERIGQSFGFDRGRAIEAAAAYVFERAVAGAVREGDWGDFARAIGGDSPLPQGLQSVFDRISSGEIGERPVARLQHQRILRGDIDQTHEGLRPNQRGRACNGQARRNNPDHGRRSTPVPEFFMTGSANSGVIYGEASTPTDAIKLRVPRTVATALINLNGCSSDDYFVGLFVVSRTHTDKSPVSSR